MEKEFFRFSVKVPENQSVYKYAFTPHVSTFNSDQNRVSGWIEADKVIDLELSFPGLIIELIPEEIYNRVL